LFWRGQDGPSSYDIDKNCIEEAYNGRHPRLGLILEGIKSKDFVDTRFSSTHRSAT